MSKNLLKDKLDKVLPDTGIAPMWGRWPAAATDYNSHNYRGSELEIDPDSKLLVISVGCSWTFGPYLKLEECYHSVVAKRIEESIGGPVTVWNLGAVGASNDYIARTCVQVAEQYRKKCPILALISFTIPDRREYIDVLGEIFPYLPCNAKPHVRFPHQHTIDENLTNLVSQYDDYLRFYRNYKLIEYCFRALDIDWFFTHLPVRTEVYELAEEQFLDKSKFVGRFVSIDLGNPIDPGHPGVQSNLLLADKIWEKVSPITKKWSVRNNASSHSTSHLKIESDAKTS